MPYVIFRSVEGNQSIVSSLEFSESLQCDYTLAELEFADQLVLSQDLGMVQTNEESVQASGEGHLCNADRCSRPPTTIQLGLQPAKIFDNIFAMHVEVSGNRSNTGQVRRKVGVSIKPLTQEPDRMIVMKTNFEVTFDQRGSLSRAHWASRKRRTLNVCQRALQGGTFHVPACKATIVVTIRQAGPALLLLTGNVGLGRFPLRIERVKLLSRPSSVDLRV